MNKTSKLDAVNSILSAVNQSPVNSLDQTTVDVTQALQYLDKASREVQGEGWKFNTESNYKLTPVVGGEITLPLNVVSVRLDPYKYSRQRYDLSIRGQKLYNNITSSYTFSEQLIAEVVLLFDWDELPEHVRSYVMLKARREYQNDVQGSDSAARVQSQDELQAFIKLKRTEGWQNERTYLGTFTRGLNGNCF